MSDKKVQTENMNQIFEKMVEMIRKGDRYAARELLRDRSDDEVLQILEALKIEVERRNAKAQ